MKAGVITVSDRCSQGIAEDKSGPFLKEKLEALGFEVTSLLIPDEKPLIKEALLKLADEEGVNLIITTGGTGFSQRDVTPEATLEVMERNAFGISEAIRNNNPNRHAMLSRGVAVIRGKTLIINFPGSPNACEQALEVVAPALSHALGLLEGLKLDR